MKRKITSSDLHKYLLSYFEEGDNKYSKADEDMKLQDIKTGEEINGDSPEELSAPLIYSNIAKALLRADISPKKAVAILQDIGEANDDKISEKLAKEIIQNNA